MVMASLRNFFTMQPAPVPLHEERAFVTGPGTVDQSQVYFGIGNETYQPGEYVNYPATSNGVYACVNVRARTLAGLPLKVYRLDAKGDRTEITSGPLWLLLRKVNPYWTLSRLLDMTEQSMGVWGECFWFMSLKGNQPTEIWWARADRVKVHPHPTDYISHFTYEGPNGTPIRFERNETVWLRYANVADQYSGLSPLAAARLAADTASAAMHSNHAIFRNGSQIAGMVVPLNGVTFSEAQAKDVADDLSRKFKGVENAHRLAVLRMGVDIKSVTLTPKDAEFLGALNWTLEDIARAYSVPIDKIGGKRTYQNVEESEKVFWHDCMLPEARFIAAELTEQLLPAFGENLIAEFDTSDVDVLHEAENDRWTRTMQQIQTGYDSINNLRKEDGLDPVPWGDVWWAQSTLIPIDSNEKPEPVMPMLGDGADEADNALDQGDQPKALADGRSRSYSRELAYGSDEHQRLWNRYVAKTAPYETQWARMTADLFNAQKQSVLSAVYRAAGRQWKRDDTPPALAEQIADALKETLTEPQIAALESLAENPFDLAKWTKTFRVESRELTTTITEAMGQLAANEVGLATGFNVKDPNIIRGIESQVQKFAESVNETTWDTLKLSIQEGIRDGDSIDDIAKRVETVMGDRIKSSSQLIARTEVNRAVVFGSLEGWKQSGVVEKVKWIAALDDRTRPTHVEAHGQVVNLGDDFTVGGCTGPGPGNLDCAREVVNCRCFPGDTLVTAEAIQGASMRLYDGNIVRVVLSDGREFSATPNHPMLTTRGWVEAGTLNNGDYLVSHPLVKDVILSDPYPNQRPATFAEVFRFLVGASQPERIRGAIPDFHGDGMNGEINVVRTHRQLRDCFAPPIDQPITQGIFTPTNDRKRFLPALGACTSGVSRNELALIGSHVSHADAHGLASAAWVDSRVEQATPNDRSADSERFRNSLFGFSGCIATNDSAIINSNTSLEIGHALGGLLRQPSGSHEGSDLRSCEFAHTQPSLFGLTANLDSCPCQDGSDRLVVSSEHFADVADGLPRSVALDYVVAVNIESFHGPVYNLHTKHGWYSANGVIAHNCSMVAVLDVPEPGADAE